MCFKQPRLFSFAATFICTVPARWLRHIHFVSGCYLLPLLEADLIHNDDVECGCRSAIWILEQIVDISIAAARFAIVRATCAPFLYYCGKVLSVVAGQLGWFVFLLLLVSLYLMCNSHSLFPTLTPMRKISLCHLCEESDELESCVR